MMLADTDIRVGDRVLGKYKKTLQWFECVVVGQGEDGKWVVEWDDGDPQDSLKEGKHLKKMSVKG